jgi:hypothetical protein
MPPLNFATRRAREAEPRKALGAVYANSNPDKIAGVSMFGITLMQTIDQDFDTVKVFP